MDTIKSEAITHFQNLLRINTTNPPGNELEAVKYIASVLDKEKISYTIVEPKPSRASLVARLSGNGEKKPLLLTSHLDVVPVESKNWEVDPFSGTIKDNCIWGRGAVDMKQMAAMSLMTLLDAKREKWNLKRDLIFAAVADEEAGCENGSQWLVENRPELIQAEYALNEVGGFSLFVDDVDNQVFYPIGVSEKGACWFKITARGDPGHGSMPHNNQALVRICFAATRLGQCHLPVHQHNVVKKFINTLASYQKFSKKLVLKLMSVPWLNKMIIEKILPDKKRSPSFFAMFRNTVTPTILQAGQKINVIPSEATLEVDGRIIPGQTIETFLNEVKKIIGADYHLEVMRQIGPSQTEYSNPFYELLVSKIKTHDPKAISVPYLIPGFTDAAFYSKLGIQCYGFTPLKLDKNMNFTEMFHGHNERIPVEGFLWGLKVLRDVVYTACV